MRYLCCTLAAALLRTKQGGGVVCSCDWNFQCSRCAGDPRQDWRLEHDPDPAEERDDEQRRAEYQAYLSELRRANG